jgi:aspartyl protease family protein
MATGAFSKRFEQFTQKASLVWIGVFWLVVMGVLYAGMTHYSSQRQAVVTTNGVMTIKKDRDGHFYIPGAVNGHGVMFVVDTGATLISVSSETARLANLPPGEPAQFNTAAGTRSGTIVSGVTVQVGSISVTNMRVGTGLQMGNDPKSDVALLGQNFLNKFKIWIENNEMILSPLGQQPLPSLPSPPSSPER